MGRNIDEEGSCVINARGVSVLTHKFVAGLSTQFAAATECLA